MLQGKPVNLLLATGRIQKVLVVRCCSIMQSRFYRLIIG